MVLATKQKRPVSIQHKKRHGRHHKVTHSYSKTYWPYLPLLLIIFLGLTLNSFWTNNNKDVLGYATDMSASELTNDTNAQRNENGLSSLNENTELDSAAQSKAENMVQLDYWSHDTPSGQPPWVFISASGYSYATAGENLAYGFDTSEDVIAAWMASPEHRANILDTTYKDVGFGIANSSDYQSSGPETVVVAEYASPANSPAPKTSSAPVDNQSAQTPSSSSTSPSAANPTPAPTTTPSSPYSPTPTIKSAATSPSNTKPNLSPNNTIGVNPTNSRFVPNQTQQISRIQLLSSTQSTWGFATVSLVAIGCMGIFFLRHVFIWRKVLRKGEKFAIKYHVLDIILITVGVIGFLLTRNAGSIH